MMATAEASLETRSEKLHDISQLVCDKFDLVPKNLQLIAWLHLLDNTSDLIVNLPVGYGKSLIYQLYPTVYSLLHPSESPCVLVVSPLNMIQHDQLLSMLSRNIPACQIDTRGVVKTSTEIVDVEDVAQGKFQVVLCHPESLFTSRTGNHLLSSSSFTSCIKAVFIDECHVIDKWQDDFRTDFSQLKTLPAFFPSVPLVAMSGTMNEDSIKVLTSNLNLRKPEILRESPDVVNVKLTKIEKKKSKDVLSIYEDIFHPLCENLKDEYDTFPITLMYIPMFYMSQAIAYLRSLFGNEDISSSCYSAIFSNQDPEITDVTLKDLQSPSPRIKLVLSTSVAGMGFDPPSVVRVIHACPPRSLVQYMQEIGRAGRRGQASEAILYYRGSDISSNLPGISDDIVQYCRNNDACLRQKMLSFFGFQKDSSLSGCSCCSFCENSCECVFCEDLSLSIE